MKYYWASFSNGGESVGVCIVEGNSEQDALHKMFTLGLMPLYDDVAIFEMDHMDDDSTMELNRLYVRDELIAMGYTPVASVKKK